MSEVITHGRESERRGVEERRRQSERRAKKAKARRHQRGWREREQAADDALCFSSSRVVLSSPSLCFRCLTIASVRDTRVPSPLLSLSPSSCCCWRVCRLLCPFGRRRRSPCTSLPLSPPTPSSSFSVCESVSALVPAAEPCSLSLARAKRACDGSTQGDCAHRRRLARSGKREERERERSRVGSRRSASRTADLAE